jgi:deaminated glutathione amidase
VAVVAAIQMTSGNEVGKNLGTAEGLLRQAKEAGAGVACLPENFSFMAVRDSDRRAMAETDGDGPVQSFLAATARALRLWILGGSVGLRHGSDGRLTNSALLFDDEGRRVARYDKIHLFDVTVPGHPGESYAESAHVAPGSECVLADTPAGRLGLSVCYDVRFPELYRELMARGAQWLAVPAAFTVPTGRAHWESLLRARAIENLCYVVAPAQTGRHPNERETYGHSLIIDYWGTVIASRESGEGLACAAFDLAEQAAARNRFPALENRRFNALQAQSRPR